MARYECAVCGYVYDESTEGGSWDSLPDDWVCPACATDKSQFRLDGGGQPAVGDSEPVAAQRAPRANRAVMAHRVFGWMYLAIYVLLMVQMVPRLWLYQIEFPARTVVHLSLGMAIGAVLVVKILVVRFFRRLDQALVPLSGTFLVVGSVVLIGISVPSAFQEAVATRRLLNDANRQRVAKLLAQIDLDAASCARLTTLASLRAGQRVLRQECIYCHDLRTVLAKPRTPENWRQTVQRMADLTTVLRPIDEESQLLVTAYLIALSPDLQQSVRRLRQEQHRQREARQAAGAAAAKPSPATAYDVEAARQLFEDKCSQCHEASDVEKATLDSEQSVRELVAAMVDEGMEATDEELSQLVRYLTDSYVKAKE